MSKDPMKLVWMVAFLISTLLQGCTSVQQAFLGTATPTPTLTPTLTPTPSPTSTATPTRTPTPNVAATEFWSRRNSMYLEIQNYVDRGYLPYSTGAYSELPDYEGDFAQINWYQWQPTTFTGNHYVVSAHFSWSTASESTHESGCGFSIGSQRFGRFGTPQVFILHRSKVMVLDRLSRESKALEGTGSVNIPSPMAADFTLIIDSAKKTAHVLVDQEFVGTYELEYDDFLDVGYTILSGTSADYGTHCEITEVRTWKLK